MSFEFIVGNKAINAKTMSIRKNKTRTMIYGNEKEKHGKRFIIYRQNEWSDAFSFEASHHRLQLDETLCCASLVISRYFYFK